MNLSRRWTLAKERPPSFYLLILSPTVLLFGFLVDSSLQWYNHSGKISCSATKRYHTQKQYHTHWHTAGIRMFCVQSTSFRLVSVVITLLLLMGVIGVVVLVIRTTPTSSLATSRRLTPTNTSRSRIEGATVTTPLAQQSLAQQGLRRSEEGGFSFTALPAYELDITATSATLTNQGGAIFLLRGGPPEQLSSVQSDELAVIFAEFVTFYASRDNFQSRNQQRITISGAPGLAVDLVSDLAGEATVDQFAGRIVMVQPKPAQLFLLVGISPASTWDSRAKTDFATLVDSIQFSPLSSGQPTTSATLRPTSVPTSAVPTATAGAPRSCRSGPRRPGCRDHRRGPRPSRRSRRRRRAGEASGSRHA